MAEPKTRALTIRFSAQEDEILQRLSEELQISTAAVVRRAVVAFGNQASQSALIAQRLERVEQRLAALASRPFDPALLPAGAQVTFEPATTPKPPPRRKQ